MPIFQATLAMTAACIVFSLLARRARLPYPVILVLGGMLAALIPGLPVPRLEPDFALAFFLPPLLQGSAYRTDWRAFRQDIRPILGLALGAVVFTTVCVAFAARQLIPGLPWAAAIALGAIVAPPDAVAASAVLQRLRIPRRLVTVLEGESLMNDASSLVIYRFAIGAFYAGSVSAAAVGLTFVLVAVGGIVIGWGLARATIWAIPRLRDSLLELCLGFLVSFAAYMLAEAVHASGVLSVVTCGLVLGTQRHTAISARTRLDGAAVFSFCEYLLNSLVFILIGLQLNGILDRITDHSLPWLAGLAVVMSLVVIVSRFAWVFAAYGMRHLGSRFWREAPPPWRYVTVVAWAGMRGVVSLAAALGLPEDFPQRDIIVFLAFCAILATLVLQGTTLEGLIRRLDVEVPKLAGMHPQEAAARRILASAMLHDLEARLDDPLEGAIAADIVAEYRDRAELYSRAAAVGGEAAELRARLSLRLAALRAGRAELLRRIRDGGIEAEILATVETELDMEETRLRNLLGA